LLIKLFENFETSKVHLLKMVHLNSVIVAEKRAKVQKELSEIDELYKKEEMNDINDEELEYEMLNMKENSEEAKKAEENDKLGIESNNISIVGNEGNNEIVMHGSATEDTSNGLYLENAEQESNQVHPEALGDKEFEPIYDE
jgi:hypothetical protein